MQPPFFNEAQIRSVLRLEDLIPVMRRTLMDFSAGKVRQPLRTILPVPEHNGFFAAVPAVYGEVMGAKLVTVFPENAAKGLPTHLATIQLFRTFTGEPLAVMDGRLITEMRTAAVSAVAADLCAPADARVLAILGSGVQAGSHWEALRLVRTFAEIRVWSPNREHARAFAKRAGCAMADSAEEAVRGADVVVTATSATEPVLRGAWLKRGAYVNAVGAVGGAARELDDDAMRGTLVVESREAVLRESGDVIRSGAKVFAEIGELLAGTAGLPAGGNVVFKSVGMAAEDLAAARLACEALTASGIYESRE